MNTIRQIIFVNQCHQSTVVEVGTRDSAIRIELFDCDLYETAKRGPRWFDRLHLSIDANPKPDPDLVMLYEYLKESGRVIPLTPNIAAQTIQFLKETN